MKLLVAVLSLVGFAATARQEQADRHDYIERASQFFQGVDKMAAQAEMAPSPDCVEGDMILTDEQAAVYRALRSDTNTRSAHDRERVRRDAEAVFRVWPNRTLVYRYDESMTSTTKLIVQEAMQIYKEYTNIKFLEAVDGSYTGSVVPLTIKQTGSGCYASVGFTGSGGGVINLQSKNCDQIGIALHELGHALFRFHEQTRSDRDDHVTVDESNILSGFASNFKKSDQATIGPYDLQSVMHYHSHAFAVDSSHPTIITKNSNDMDKMGKQHKLSRLDIYVFNYAYGAYDNCPSDLWEKCQRGGVPSKHCTCNCLAPFEGSYCDIFVPPTECSGLYSGPQGSVYSPGFPGYYTSNADCTYAIECADDEVVQLKFTSFELEDWNCWYDKMEMMTGELFSEIYPDEYCGDKLQDQLLLSRTNVAVLNFKSDLWYNFPGFQIDFECLPRLAASAN